MRTFAAVLAGKIIQKLTRSLNLGGGFAAPGLYALKVDPSLIEKLIKKIPRNIIITGTNGKTTTARMLAHLAKEAGLKVIRNHTGSNLERGIASTLISHYTLYPKLYTLDLGIWELDEAAFNPAALKINPDIVIFLNVFRDQLDRYGEIDTVVRKWCETLKVLDPKTIVLVNGDDNNTLKLKRVFRGKVYTFGVENFKIKGESIEKNRTRQKLDFEAKSVKLKGLDGSSFGFRIQNSEFRINLPLPGLYHIYDAITALACASFLKIPKNISISSLKNYLPAFGRFEKISLQPSRLHRKNGFIFLIKNPAGATQVFETIAPQIEKEDRLLIALNDNLADGTDVSWIWDANFEILRTMNYELRTICSGTRAYDLGIRLKYAGFDPKGIEIESDLKKAFEQAQMGLKGHLFILPTYTAMLQLQRILTKSGIKKHYWEEEN